MVGWHHQLNGHEFEQAPGTGDRQGSLACCSLWGCKESDTTEQLKIKYKLCVGKLFMLFPVTSKYHMIFKAPGILGCLLHCSNQVKCSFNVMGTINSHSKSDHFKIEHHFQSL